MMPLGTLQVAVYITNSLLLFLLSSTPTVSLTIHSRKDSWLVSSLGLLQSVEHAAFDLGVVSWESISGIEIT